MTPTLPRALSAAVTLLALSACLAPTAPIPTRWFVPRTPAAAETRTEPGPGLLIARVTAAAHLGVPMVWRLSDVEIALDDVRLWADTPAAMIEVELDRTLHASGRFADPTASAGPRLFVHVEAFEAVIGGDNRAQVALALRLDPADGSRAAHGRVEGSAPLASREPEDVARSIGDALGIALGRTADWCAAQVGD